jgi:FlaA1/EpsC-like NDP-sugar epimerase
MFTTNALYQEDLAKIATYPVDWDQFQDKSILITGATGLIGTMLIDALMYRNIKYRTNITVYAVGRNKEKAAARFGEYFSNKNFVFIKQ